MNQDNNTPDLIEYVIETNVYTDQGAKFTSDCNSIGFMNRSKYPCYINTNIYLEVNADGTNLNIFWINGSIGEVDRTQYQINFDPRDIKNGLATLVVIRKIYRNAGSIAKKLNYGK